MTQDDWGIPDDGFGTDEGFGGLDTEGVDENDVQNKRFVDKTGMYHFEIAEAKERPDPVTDEGNERRPDIRLACVALESVPGQSPAGSYYYHNIILAGKGGGELEDWAKRSTITFLVGVGLLKKVEKGGEARFVDPETKSTRIDVASLATRLKGMQFIGDIKLNKSEQYADRYELLFGKGAYAVDDPAVADVPKNKDALALI